jgi:hypothetical protein
VKGKILMLLVVALMLALPAVPAFASSVLRGGPYAPSLASAPEGGHNYGTCQSHFATTGDPQAVDAVDVFGDPPYVANPSGGAGWVCPQL